MSPLRMGFSVLSPAGLRGRLSVLIFHRVLPHPDPIFPGEVDATQFDSMMGWVKSWFNVLPLDEAVRRLKTSTLPARAAAITFDDGYEDNYSVALPILQRHGLTATFFIATGFLDGGRMWNDTVIETVRAGPPTELDLSSIGLGNHQTGTPAKKQKAIAAIIRQLKYLPMQERLERTERLAAWTGFCLPNDLMMTSDQVRAMRRAGMQIGAHTVSHPILARLDALEAKREIRDSKTFLEDLLGERIVLFAYPNGKPRDDYLPDHALMASELGFDAAVSTAWGAAKVGDDPFQVPRFTPWDRSRFRFGMRLLRGLRI